MGIAKADSSELISTYFRYLQRDQIQDVKYTLGLLKASNSSGDNNVTFIDTLKLKKSGDTSLHICARNGFLDLIKYLIEDEGANLELINFDGKTALHDAAQFSQLDILDYLLARGANVNVVKKADWTPLMLACTKDNFEVVKSLVAAGANLNFVNKDGWTCIHIAAREGYLEILSFLLSSCADPVERNKLKEKKSRNGRRAIHTAVLHGHLDAVRLLTSDGTSHQLNEEDTSGASPLLDACRCGFIHIAEYLIENVGIAADSLNKNGVGALHVAAEANQADMIEFLVNKYRLDINQPSLLLSFTPLHWACREGNLSAIRALFKLGASLEIKDSKEKTATDIARECGKVEVCKFFANFS